MKPAARVVAIVLRLGVCWPLLFVGGLFQDLADSVATFCTWIEDHA